MTGKLGLFSLVDLFQLLASARRTGRLTVDHPVTLARIYFDGGRVIHAEFGELKGTDAVFTLFADERGDFEFRIGLSSPGRTITMGTENLVLEAMRRLDEVSRGVGAAEEEEGHGVKVQADAVPVLPERESASRGEFALNAEELELLRHVDGHRTVASIAALLDREPFEVRVICERLMRIGVLRLKSRRARTARLVARLTRKRLPEGHVGVDANIVRAWQNALDVEVNEVACRRSTGSVHLFRVTPIEGSGPYLEITRETLTRVDLRVDETLLVRPVTDHT